MTEPLTESELRAAADACREISIQADELLSVARSHNDTDAVEHHSSEMAEWRRLSLKFLALAKEMQR